VNKALVLSLVLAATPAHADDQKAAEAYFRAGAKAYAAQNFAAAAENFDEAYRAAPLPELAFSAAQAYRRWFKIDPKRAHVQRSVELYRAYLAVVKTGGRVGDAADNLQEMERELEKLKLSPASGAPDAARTRIGVSIAFADQRADTEMLREIAEVGAGSDGAKNVVAMIDGKAVEPFALVEVAAKEHVIRVSADGYVPVEKTKVAVTGLSSLVEVELQPKPAMVKVATEPGAQVVVDGRTVATTPAASLSLPSGRHLIAVLHRGREPFGQEIVLGRGQQLTLDAHLEQTARRRAVPYIVGGAGLLAAAAIVTGIVAIVHDGKARDLRDDLTAGNRPPSDGDRYDDQVRARDRYVTVTWVLGGAAVAAGTIGALLYVFDKPSAESVRLTPSVAPGAGGVTLGGSF